MGITQSRTQKMNLMGKARQAPTALFWRASGPDLLPKGADELLASSNRIDATLVAALAEVQEKAVIGSYTDLLATLLPGGCRVSQNRSADDVPAFRGGSPILTGLPMGPGPGDQQARQSMRLVGNGLGTAIPD